MSKGGGQNKGCEEEGKDGGRVGTGKREYAGLIQEGGRPKGGKEEQ